jgi:hypothetical protein
MINRGRFLTASTTLVAAAAAPAGAADIPGGSEFVEGKAQFDMAAFDAVVGRPAQIRQLIEAVAFKPGLWNNVKNSFNGLQFGYGHAPSGIAIAIAGHGPSAAYGYSDYVWKKYRIGEFFKITDAQGNTIGSNIWLRATSTFDPSANPNDEHGMYQDTSIEMLQKRGLIMLTCHTAVEEQSRALVKGGFAPAGMSAQDVADDILTHLIPGTLVNPSMIATVAVLQKVYSYTYAALTF